MSSGSQKKHATKGKESEAGERYRELREIIIDSSAVPFKEIIERIAGIKVGSFYNYTAEGTPKFGRISQYTVENLSNYFNLPQGIFNCSLPFTNDVKETIKQKIQSDFGEKNNITKLSSINKPKTKDTYSQSEDDIINTLEYLYIPLNNIHEIEISYKINDILEKLLKINTARIESLKILNDIE